MTSTTSSTTASDLATQFTGDAGAVPLAFSELTDYGEYSAQYTDKDGALVVHFYPNEKTTRAVWKDLLPAAFSEVGPDYFRREYPSIRAQKVEDCGIDSWWLCADGVMASAIDSAGLLSGFFSKVTETLRRYQTKS